MSDNRYRPLSFWSFNEKMELSEVKRQIEEFKNCGYAGFFMHARAGLEIGYMSDEWFEVCETAVLKAKECGLEVWLYDENGWPSGFADGKVPARGDDFVAKHLYFTPKCPVNHNDIIGSYKRVGKGYAFCEDLESCELFCCVGRLAGYADLLNENSVKAFITYTHEEYKKHLGEYFGTVIKGIFTDEPQVVGKFPYTYSYPEKFFNEYGIDFKKNAWMLNSDLPETVPFKYKTNKLFAKLFNESFTAQIEKWCNENGIIFTGHFSNEDGLCHQTKVNFNLMEHYKNMSRPGIDFLGRRLTSPVLTKQIADSAYIHNKNIITSESYGCAGWDVSFNDLSLIASWQAAFGINSIVTHLSAYSIKGRRKRDYPAFYSYQEPWWEAFNVLASDIANVNSFISAGKRKPHILLLHPASGMWCLNGGSVLFTDKTKEYASQFRVLVESLLDIGNDFVIISEEDFKEFKYEKGNYILGDKSFDTVIVPQTMSLEKSTYELLAKTESENRVLFINQKPELCEGEKSLLSESINGTVIQNRRDFIEKFFKFAGICDDVFVTDKIGEKSAKGLITSKKYLDNGEERICIVNPSDTDTKKITVKFLCNRSVFDATSALVMPLKTLFDGKYSYANFEISPKMTALVKAVSDSDQAKNNIQNCVRTVNIDSAFVMGDNTLTIDKCDVIFNGIKLFENTDIVKATDEIYEKAYKENTTSKITLKYSFNVNFQNNIPDDIMLAAETEKTVELSINGVILPIDTDEWYIDRAIKKYPIGQYLKNGENIVTISFLITPPEKIDELGNFEGNKNKFFYPYEPESIYIVGKFDVKHNGKAFETNEYYTLDGDFEITDFSSKVPGELTKQNLWFYSGKYKVTAKFAGESDKDYALNIINPMFTCAEVSVNGNQVGFVFKSPFEIKLSDIVDGENSIEIVLFGSNRNVFGPHHHIKGNPHFVGPDTFSGKKSWSDFIYPDIVDESTYTDRYSFVKYGIDCLQIKQF